ncbi:hypothetical protein ACPOL_6871 (plasmid) [Acidisarcina polymorpha]|uniref:Uncharacterized protein n=2 Tax=Acidisarcina polymorpha TaxID=2211140 RepID=A0A2Z5GAQ5_9BACT|nr:hypothetical protein ACPOL_6871 [Acidisarcina polymorpha]
MIDGYEQALVVPKKTAVVEGEDLGPIRAVLNQSRNRRWHHLAEERIKDVTPQIPLGEKFWALREEERAEIDELFQDEAIATKVTSFKGRDSEAKLRVLDAAYWMKGCSSLGRLRYAVYPSR